MLRIVLVHCIPEEGAGWDDEISGPFHSVDYAMTWIGDTVMNASKILWTTVKDSPSNIVMNGYLEGEGGWQIIEMLLT